MRLIDADALIKVIQQNDYMLTTKHNSMAPGMFTSGIRQAVDESQTIDPVKWIPVSERLPENQKRVLVCGLSNYNHTSRTMFKAEYIRKMTVTADDYGWSEDCDYDYDEEKDENYVPEGWYESIMNWDEYSSVAVTDFTVTHWMPLPDPPRKDDEA